MHGKVRWLLNTTPSALFLSHGICTFVEEKKITPTQHPEYVSYNYRPAQTLATFTLIIFSRLILPRSASSQYFLIFP